LPDFYEKEIVRLDKYNKWLFKLTFEDVLKIVVEDD